jgi:uncharacterized membrane protein YidH (DUF202 family)
MPKDDVQAHLAHKRTELAQERTILAYLRTAASFLLFGIAFLGFREHSLIFLYGGYGAISLGVFFVITVVYRGLKHKEEIELIQKIFKFKVRHKK